MCFPLESGGNGVSEELEDLDKDTDLPVSGPDSRGKQPASCPDILPQAPIPPEEGEGQARPIFHSPSPRARGSGEGAEVGPRD